MVGTYKPVWQVYILSDIVVMRPAAVVGTYKPVWRVHILSNIMIMIDLQECWVAKTKCVRFIYCTLYVQNSE